jgi:hypothetical protein
LSSWFEPTVQYANAAIFLSPEYFHMDWSG